MSQYLVYVEFVLRLYKPDQREDLHCKKRLAIFPSPARMSLPKLYLAGKNLIIPGQGEFGK
jgi:hypothetical protein